MTRPAGGNSAAIMSGSASSATASSTSWTRCSTGCQTPVASTASTASTRQHPRLLLPQVREHLAARDGRRHIAIAAFASRTPVGIARLIALDDYRGEIAVEVVDAWQRRGIGARLVRAITERGRFLGHTEIVADVLAENSAARGLLTSIFPKPNAATDGPEITFTVDLTTNDPAPATRAVA